MFASRGVLEWYVSFGDEESYTRWGTPRLLGIGEDLDPTPPALNCTQTLGDHLSIYLALRGVMAILVIAYNQCEVHSSNPASSRFKQ